ncbi:MAG: polysaccharide deacetylase family protein [Gemmataceae bacterium]
MLSAFTILKDRQQIGLREKEILLTFDDGPNELNELTERLLDVLQRSGVKACFALIGDQVEKAPHTVQRMWEEGHLVVNHTQSHTFAVLGQQELLESEVAQCNETIGAALGIEDFQAAVFRPPGGMLTGAVKRYLRENNVTIAPVSHFAWDTLYSPRNYGNVVTRILSNAQRYDGGAYVLHDYRHHDPLDPLEKRVHPRSAANRSWVPEAVEQIIRKLHKYNYEIVDPQEFFSRSPNNNQNGN